jgi:hypothetical protein
MYQYKKIGIRKIKEKRLTGKEYPNTNGKDSTTM